MVYVVRRRLGVTRALFVFGRGILLCDVLLVVLLTLLLLLMLVTLLILLILLLLILLVLLWNLGLC